MTNVIPRQVTEARRRVLIKIVFANQGCALADVLAAARELHAGGHWPQSAAPGARNDPYDTGCRQLLLQAVRDGRLLRYTVGEDMRDHFCTPTHAKMIAPGYLPDGAEQERCEALIRRFQHEAGMDMALGVTERLQCLVRVQSPRGLIDWHDWRRGDEWEDGIIKAAAAMGVRLS